MCDTQYPYQYVIHAITRCKLQFSCLCRSTSDISGEVSGSAQSLADENTEYSSVQWQSARLALPTFPRFFDDSRLSHKMRRAENTAATRTARSSSNGSARGVRIYVSSTIRIRGRIVIRGKPRAALVRHGALTTLIPGSSTIRWPCNS